MPWTPKVRRAVFTSSSMNGFTMAVTSWTTGSSLVSQPRSRLRGSVGSLPARWSLCSRFRRGIGRGRHRLAGVGGVGEALAELHVVGGEAVLGDVDALELEVFLDAEVPRTGQRADG